MKTIRYIFTAAFSILMVLACVKEGPQEDVPANESLLKVRLSVPEIEVKSSPDSAIYAYIPSEIKEGTLNPISETIVNKGDGATYYNLPSGTSEVAFSNLSGGSDEKIDISIDKDGNICYSVDTVATAGSYFFDGEILAGYIDGVVPGTKEPYDVSIKRLSSKITTNFRVKDDAGSSMSLYYIISSVKVEYSGIADSATLLKDEAIAISGNHNDQIYLKANTGYSDNKLYYHSACFIPSSNIPSVTVTITRKSGIVQTYTKSLGKKLEPNRHYTVNLSVTNHNGGTTFEVNEPEVTVSTPVTPEVNESDFFSVSENPTLSPEAGSELLIDVTPLLPYEWTFKLEEDAEKYFAVEKIDGQLKAVAKETNDGDFRFGNITLMSTEGDYTKTFAIRQYSTRKHEIIMTYKGSSSWHYIFVTGENITVQDPNDANPRVFKTANATQIEINGLKSGSVITVRGDLITEFFAQPRVSSTSTQYRYQLYGSYYYDGGSSNESYAFEFNNCRYLKALYMNSKNPTLDFSGMPDLKQVVLGSGSDFTSVTFAEGQGVELFKAYECNQIQQLDLRNISGTLQTVKINDCDALLGANFKNFTKLKHIDLGKCSKMGSINLSGCTSLEAFYLDENSAASLNISDCSSLKILEWNTTLETLVHDGADAIESVKGGYVSTFDFSGKTSLKKINGLGALQFNVSGCVNLESMGHIYSVGHLNTSNCPLLKELDVNFCGSSGETYEFTDCPNISTIYFDNMTAECDFSPLTGLKNIYLTDLYGKSIKTIDLTANTLLKNVEFQAYSSNLTLSKILLPNSVKNLKLNRLRELHSLDLSNHTNLEDVDIDSCDYLEDMNFSGCSALKDLDFYYISYCRSGKINLSGCSSLVALNNDHSNPYLNGLKSVDFTGCSSLEYVNLYNGEISKLDFSDSPKLTYLDIRYNAMTKESIDAMFVSMPDWSVDDGFVTGAYMLSNNASGYTGYNKSAANAKNWWSIE